MIKVTAFGDLDSQSTGLDVTQTIRSCVKVFIKTMSLQISHLKKCIYTTNIKLCTATGIITTEFKTSYIPDVKKC